METQNNGELLNNTPLTTLQIRSRAAELYGKLIEGYPRDQAAIATIQLLQTIDEKRSQIPSDSQAAGAEKADLRKISLFLQQSLIAGWALGQRDRFDSEEAAGEENDYAADPAIHPDIEGQVVQVTRGNTTMSGFQIRVWETNTEEPSVTYTIPFHESYPEVEKRQTFLTLIDEQIEATDAQVWLATDEDAPQFEKLLALYSNITPEAYQEIANLVEPLPETLNYTEILHHPNTTDIPYLLEKIEANQKVEASIQNEDDRIALVEENTAIAYGLLYARSQGFLPEGIAIVAHVTRPNVMPYVLPHAYERPTVEVTALSDGKRCAVQANSQSLYIDHLRLQHAEIPAYISQGSIQGFLTDFVQVEEKVLSSENIRDILTQRVFEFPIVNAAYIEHRGNYLRARSALERQTDSLREAINTEGRLKFLRDEIFQQILFAAQQLSIPIEKRTYRDHMTTFIDIVIDGYIIERVPQDLLSML